MKSVFYVGRHYNRIVKKLAILGMCVEVRMVGDGLKEKSAFALERQRIAFWRNAGVALANKTDGGEGNSGGVRTPIWRARVSASHMGKSYSDETIARMKVAAKKRMTKKMRKHLSKVIKGRKHTEDAIAKISAAQTGRKRKPFSAEHRANISVAQTGKVLSSEHKAKIAAANKGRVITWGDKISAAQKGKPRPNFIRRGDNGRFVKTLSI